MDEYNENAIKILHLYPDLMNLYGEWANMALLERELTSRACASVIERKSVGDEIDFSSYNFIYIGSGTERSLYACIRDITRHKEALAECIENGMPLLATGNSHEIFGHAVTDAKHIRHNAIGLLDFETVHLTSRVTGDCMCRVSFLPDRLVGFINRAGGTQEGPVKRPFVMEFGPGVPNKNKTDSIAGSRTEGVRYKNLLGTYMTGPVLVRNPPLMKYFADLLENKGFKKNYHDMHGNELPCINDNNAEPALCARSAPDLLFDYLEAAYGTAI